MKKVLTLVALLIVTPAIAATNVTFSIDPTGVDGVYELNYASSDANLPRAFGLDITTDNGATIEDINNVNANFPIYPGQIVIVDGNVSDYNTPVGAGAIGSNSVTIEMGSLYTTDSNYSGDDSYDRIPALSGTICTIEVSADCNLCIAGNEDRAGSTGVVLEDYNPNTTSNLDPPLCEAVTAGAGCSCWGDISGPTPGVPDGQVSTSDMSALLNTLSGYAPTYSGPIPAGMECMDVSGPTPGVPDGVLSTSDMSALLNHLSNYAPTYSGPCMTVN